MTPIVLQTWAAAALWMACVALGMRANMLKPQIAAWCSPPQVVWIALMFQSLVMAGAALSLLNANAAAVNTREVAVYTACAISSVVMFVNLAVQRNRPNAANPAFFAGRIHPQRHGGTPRNLERPNA